MIKKEVETKPLDFRWIAFVTSLIVSLPILVTKYLTFFDYPNHVARYTFLSRYQDTEFFKQYFEVNNTFIPNLGFDFLAVNLGKVFPPWLAAQMVLFLAVFASSYGLCTLARRLQGKDSWLVAIPPVFLWSFSLFYGFNNYILAFAFFPWAIAIYFDFVESRSIGKFLVYISITILAFLCHAQVAALTLVFTALVGFAISPPNRRIINALVAFTPALLMGPLLAISPSTGEFSTVGWGSIKHKVAMFGQAYLSGSSSADIAFGLLLLTLLVVLLATKSVQAGRGFFFIGLGSIFLSFIFPNHLKIAANLDTRLVPIAFALAFCAIQPAVKIAKHIGTCIVVLITFRAGTMAMHLYGSGKVAEQVITDVQKLPESAMVFNAVSDSAAVFDAKTWNPATLSLPYFALWERPIYMTGLYSYPNQQPMVYNTYGKSLEYLGMEGKPETGCIERIFKNIKNRIQSKPLEFWSAHPPYLFLGIPEGQPPSLPEGFTVVAAQPKYLLAKCPIGE